MTGVSAYSQRPSARETEALVMRHAELVKRIAYHLAGRLPASVEVDDLIQAGMLGLLEAAANYSEGRGASFETYAGIRIRGAMLDGLRKLDWAPRSVHRKARAVAKAIRELESESAAKRATWKWPSAWAEARASTTSIVEDSAGCQISSLTTEEGEMTLTDSVRGSVPRCGRRRFSRCAHRGHRRSAGARATGHVPVLRRRVEPEGNRRGAARERIADLPDPRPGAGAVAGAAGRLARSYMRLERGVWK